MSDPLAPVYRTKGQHDWKQAVVNDFVRGMSVRDISRNAACYHLRVEQVLREAITGLAALTPKPEQEPTE